MSKIQEFTRFLTRHEKLDKYTIQLRAAIGKTRTIPEFLRKVEPVDYLKKHVEMFRGDWVELDDKWRDECAEADNGKKRR